MNRDKDPAEDKLPVTAELGDEGGSYGDGTVQAETFRGAGGNPRVDPKRVAPPGDAAGAVAGEDTEAEPRDDVKHATDR